MQRRLLNETEKRDWLRLSRTENVGPITFRQLVRRFGSAHAALDALPAMAQRGGRMRELELCEQSAPLYARGVARAIALVPSIGAVIALAGYWLVTAISSGPRDLSAAPVLLSMACACAVSIVALGATVRTGFWQAIYILLAAVVATTVVMLEYPQLPAAFLFCGIAGFIGLRQYGEALARWDPVV